MAYSDELASATRAEWREPGFFYDRDDAARVWRLVGDRAGLLRFRDLLREYVADPRNTLVSEHEHHGPPTGASTTRSRATTNSCTGG